MLLRGQNPANYAFTADDTGGECHDFQTFMRFELPADLLAAGETVTTAFLNVPYLFSFAIEGEPAEPPHAPVSMLVHRVATPWTEGAVSWSNRPDFELEPLDTVTGITDFGDVTFNDGVFSAGENSIGFKELAGKLHETGGAVVGRATVDPQGCGGAYLFNPHKHYAIAVSA